MAEFNLLAGKVYRAIKSSLYYLHYIFKFNLMEIMLRFISTIVALATLIGGNMYEKPSLLLNPCT